MPDPGRCSARRLLRGVKSCLLRSFEGGATVARGVVVWDVINFQFLQWYLVSDVSLVGHVMMVCFNFEAMFMCGCVVPLLKVVARSSSLVMKILGVDLRLDSSSSVYV